MEEQQDWKGKYYNAIEDLEKREEAWTEIESMLRQGLTRLSVVADTSDQELNQQLEVLRAAIRKGEPSDELKKLFEAISQVIFRMEEERKERPTMSPAELLSDLLKRIPFPPAVAKRAEALRERFDGAQSGEMGSLVEELVNLIAESLGVQVSSPESAAPAEKKGLFGKLFNKDEEGSEQGVVPAGIQTAKNLLAEMIQSLVAEPSKRESFTNRLRNTSQEAQLLTLGRELAALLQGMGDAGAYVDEDLPVNEVLVRLLERLEIPSSLGSEVEAVKGMLLDSLSANEVEKVIAAIADLIAEMRSRMHHEKAELEGFLKQLTTHLSEIDSGFQINVETQRESFRNGQSLDESVTSQVASIEDSVTQATELDELKTQIQQRVGTIRSHMKDFLDAETERLQKAEKQVEELTEKLALVQKESSQLREHMHNERSQAMIDTLTGIPNRLAYNEKIKEEVSRWQRYHTPLVIAVWDVDNFKSVNDTYGHQAGDKVLAVIGKVLHKHCRETDFIARFGGEEFVLLMPQTNVESAAPGAEKLRKAVEATEFHFRGKRVPITISCGMSEFREGDTSVAVFERADKALYKAKSAGRNRCYTG